MPGRRCNPERTLAGRFPEKVRFGRVQSGSLSPGSYCPAGSSSPGSVGRRRGAVNSDGLTIASGVASFQTDCSLPFPLEHSCLARCQRGERFASLDLERDLTDRRDRKLFYDFTMQKLRTWEKSLKFWNHFPEPGTIASRASHMTFEFHLPPGFTWTYSQIKIKGKCYWESGSGSRN